MSVFHTIRRELSLPYSLPLNTGPTWFLHTYISVSLRKLGVLLGLYDPLTRLAYKYETDKGVTRYPFHSYTLQYASLFERHRNDEINILEIGLARKRCRDNRSMGDSCPSLELWREYFPNANLYGLDIDDFSSVSMPRTKIFRGDQGRPEDLLKIVSECNNFHIIIDDGSHASFHQQKSLETLFPYLTDGGLYIIEDLYQQPEELELAMPVKIKTTELLKDTTALGEIIHGFKKVEFYDSMVANGESALGVITKA